MKQKLVHFLRCSALFFHAYTDVPLPDVDSDGVFVGLTNYLGLPNTLTALLKVPGTFDLIDRFQMLFSFSCLKWLQLLVRNPDHFFLSAILI